MSDNATVVIAGLGEVGQPLYDLISESRPTVGLDVRLPEPGPIEHVSVLHVCYPFEIPDFVGETARYIERFRPDVTVINSTVSVGTTRAVHEASGAAVANSPVRGKHSRMLEELRHYVKFIGGIDEHASRLADEHFRSVGVKTKVLPNPETTELAKLSETTYFGVLIAWAQEVGHLAEQVGADYDDVVSFYEEIGFFPPVKYFPGVIGGHCVMPNIEILSEIGPSALLDAVRSSNARQVEKEANKVS